MHNILNDLYEIIFESSAVRPSRKRVDDDVLFYLNLLKGIMIASSHSATRTGWGSFDEAYSKFSSTLYTLVSTISVTPA